MCFIVNFEHIQLFLIFLLLTLNMQMFRRRQGNIIWSRFGVFIVNNVHIQSNNKNINQMFLLLTLKMMNRITLNIVAILTKNKDLKPIFCQSNYIFGLQWKWFLGYISQTYSFIEKKLLFDLLFPSKLQLRLTH